MCSVSGSHASPLHVNPLFPLLPPSRSLDLLATTSFEAFNQPPEEQPTERSSIGHTALKYTGAGTMLAGGALLLVSLNNTNAGIGRSINQSAQLLSVALLTSGLISFVIGHTLNAPSTQ